MERNLKDGLYTIIHTSRGDIVIDLLYKKTPMTVMNFIGLAEGFLDEDGNPFYDGLNFHRVIPNFMIQGGCPLGTGTGGPNYKFPDEFDSSLRFDAPGKLAMANSGPGTNGSQFFITHVPTDWLNDRHTIFGLVVEGQDVVDTVEQGDRIESVEIIRIGDEANAFETSKAIFKEMVASVPRRAQAAMDDKINKLFPNAEKTESGLRYIVEKEGTGDKSPKYRQNVTVHYEGTLLDGTVFDSSYKRGEATTFQVGQVIEGWNEALQTMKLGEKRKLIIPPDLGYGAHGFPGVIPPNAVLIFDVELLKF